MKYLKYVLIAILLFVGVGAAYMFWYLPSKFEPKVESHEPIPIRYKANRIMIRPIIHPEMHSRLIQEADLYGYNNINGPSMIKVPEWLENPLGQYYIYFAHHKGTFIRMAYADDIAGPWRMYPYPIMPLEKSGFAQTASSKASGLSDLRKYMSVSEVAALVQVGEDAKKAYKKRTQGTLPTQGPTTPHVASPEVIVDNENKQIRMYYHGLVEGTLQMTKVSASLNGLDFTAIDGLIGAPYMRVFKHDGFHYGFAMPGLMYRSKDGLKNWEVRERWFLPANTRHSGLHQIGNLLYVFFTRVGDAPEKIVYTTIDLSDPDWNTWAVGETYSLLEPGIGWEGSLKLPVPSLRGEVGSVVNQLRDPDIFVNTDGKVYLLYAGGGESGIGIASLNRL
tara:strand:+ start:433 stop:1608 length:1176 start_codon:yes stop_codon:yes gene_type:complete